MADVIERLVAEVGADISGFMSGMGKVRSETDSISAKISGMGKSIADAGANLTKYVSLPILGFLGASVKAAADSETAIAQLNAVLKSTKGVAKVTSDMAQKLAGNLQKVTRYGDEEIISAESLLLTFTKINKDIFPDTTKLVLDMSTALGQDLKSSAIQLGKALQDPINGVTALKRVGVSFTEQQMAQIKAMTEAGNLLGAQKLIMKELATEFGGSAVAAGKTFAGQLDILKNSLGEFMEIVGKTIIPALTPLVKTFGDWAKKLQDVNPNVLRLALMAGVAVAALGPLLGIIGNITSAFGLFVGALKPIILPLLLIGGLIAAYQSNWMGFRDTVDKLGNAFRALPAPLQAVALALIPVGFMLLRLAVTTAIAALPGFITSLAGAFGALALSMLPVIAPLILIGGLFYAYTKNVLGFRDAVDKLGESLRKLFALLNNPQNAPKVTRFIENPGAASGFDLAVQQKMEEEKKRTGGKNILNNLFGGFGFRDAGGPIQAGRAFNVGVPELIIPGRGGYAMPLSQMGGGPQVIQVILRAENFEDHIYVNVADQIKNRRSRP